MNRRTFLALLTATWLSACATPPSTTSEPSQPRPSGQVVATTTESYGIDEGPGAEYCTSLGDVHDDLEARRWRSAQVTLNQMLAGFRQFEVPGKRVMSFGNEADYRAYLASAEDPETVVPVDWCYREIFQLQAFVLAAQEQFEDALLMLSKSAAVGPTAAAPFVERGYILNRLGRFEAARASYEHALALISRYPVSRDQEPLALRGLGFALIELGDLGGAETAFKRSLDLDPGNALAESELNYIRKLRRKRR